MPEYAAERSSGYEAVAQQLIRQREASAIGVGVIRHWAGFGLNRCYESVLQG